MTKGEWQFNLDSAEDNIVFCESRVSTAEDALHDAKEALWEAELNRDRAYEEDYDDE